MSKGFSVALMAAMFIVPFTVAMSFAEESQTETKQACCDKDKGCCDKAEGCCDKSKTCSNDGKCTSGKCKDCTNANCDLTNCSGEGCEKSDCKCAASTCAACDKSACQPCTSGYADCSQGDCASGKSCSELSCDALNICTGEGRCASRESSALQVFSEPLFSAPQSPSIVADYATPTPVLQAAAALPYQQVAPRPHVSSTDDVKQIQYSINIIEDSHGCLGEYEALREGAPMMFAESKTLLPAMRVLHKHQLIRQLSSPKVICTAGQTAQLQIGGESTAEGADEWEGVRLEVAAAEAEKGLMVELAMHTKEHKRRFQVRTALLVETGQTIVLNANAAPAPEGEERSEQGAVYVVLTPEVVK